MGLKCVNSASIELLLQLLKLLIFSSSSILLFSDFIGFRNKDELWCVNTWVCFILWMRSRHCQLNKSYIFRIRLPKLKYIFHEFCCYTKSADWKSITNLSSFPSNSVCVWVWHHSPVLLTQCLCYICGVSDLVSACLI